jgi:hypothetical protein
MIDCTPQALLDWINLGSGAMRLSVENAMA